MGWKIALTGLLVLIVTITLIKWTPGNTDHWHPLYVIGLGVGLLLGGVALVGGLILGIWGH